MKSKILNTTLLSVMAIFGLSGCSGDTASGGVVAYEMSSKEVTVERGKVFGATVTDSSTPAQTAVGTLNSNVYKFAKAPTYPVIVSGGYIDVDSDGEITTADIKLDMTMKSYSDKVTPISTYLAKDNNETARQERLDELVVMLQEMDGNSTVSSDDLLELPSKAKKEAVLVANSIFAKFEFSDDNLGMLNKTSIKSQLQAIKNLLLQSGIELTDANFYQKVEEAVMLNLKSNSKVYNVDQDKINEYIQHFQDSDDDSEVGDDDSGSSGSSNDIVSKDCAFVDLEALESGHSIFSKNGNTELIITFGSDYSTVQYAVDHTAVWQSLYYGYSVSGNILTLTRSQEEAHIMMDEGLSQAGAVLPSSIVIPFNSNKVGGGDKFNYNDLEYIVIMAYKSPLQPLEECPTSNITLDF